MAIMRYVYENLYVRYQAAKDFAVDELQDAIAYLRTQPEKECGGLTAVTHATVGQYRLRAEATLSFDELRRKTPDEIWSAFDAEVDRWAAGLEATHSRNGRYHYATQDEVRSNSV